MNFRKGGRQQEDVEINLIPFIDVLLVIMIFLMVTTTFSRVSELKVALPVASADAAPERKEMLHVQVEASGRVTVNGEAVSGSASSIAEALKRHGEKLRTDSRGPIVVVYADGAARHQNVVDVMEAARLCTYSRVTFATMRNGSGN